MSLNKLPKYRMATVVVTATGAGYVIYDQTSSEEHKGSSNSLTPTLTIPQPVSSTLSSPASMVPQKQDGELEEDSEEDFDSGFANMTQQLGQFGVEVVEGKDLKTLAKEAELKLMENYTKDIEAIQKVYEGKVNDADKKTQALEKRLKDLEDQLKRLEAIQKFWESQEDKRGRKPLIDSKGNIKTRANNKPRVRDPNTTPPIQPTPSRSLR